MKVFKAYYILEVSLVFSKKDQGKEGQGGLSVRPTDRVNSSPALISQEFQKIWVNSRELGKPLGISGNLEEVSVRGYIPNFVTPNP